MQKVFSIKNIFFLALGLCCLFCLFLPRVASAAPDISIKVNGQIVGSDVSPYIDNGRTMVPIRVCTQALGCQVAYESSTKKITINGGEHSIILYVGKKTASLNGKSITLDVAPVIKDGRTMVPLRFIGESLGATVNWISASRMVTIEGAASGEATLAADFEQNVLTEINAARNKFGYEPLVVVSELTTFARNHAKDMANNKYFSHTSPVYGDIASRSAKAGLPTLAGIIGKGFLSANAQVNTWMGSLESRENVLNPDHVFAGIGAYKDESGTVYVNVVFVNGDGFLIASRPSAATNSSLLLKGYSLKSQVNINIYKMSGDTTYSSRKTQIATVTNNAFTFNLNFAEAGTYKINVGNDLLTVNN